MGFSSIPSWFAPHRFCFFLLIHCQPICFGKNQKFNCTDIEKRNNFFYYFTNNNSYEDENKNALLISLTQYHFCAFLQIKDLNKPDLNYINAKALKDYFNLQEYYMKKELKKM